MKFQYENAILSRSSGKIFHFCMVEQNALATFVNGCNLNWLQPFLIPFWEPVPFCTSSRLTATRHEFSLHSSTTASTMCSVLRPRCRCGQRRSFHSDRGLSGKDIGRIREALIKLARADSERFCFPGKYEKQRNTVCISCFSYCTGEAKDTLLSRRRFIQRFPRVREKEWIYGKA